METPLVDKATRPALQAETTHRNTNYNRSWKQFSLPVLSRKYPPP